MQWDLSILSLAYPVSLLGYALLSQKPRRAYWLVRPPLPPLRASNSHTCACCPAAVGLELLRRNFCHTGPLKSSGRCASAQAAVQLLPSPLHVHYWWSLSSAPTTDCGSCLVAIASLKSAGQLLFTIARHLASDTALVYCEGDRVVLGASETRSDR